MRRVIVPSMEEFRRGEGRGGGEGGDVRDEACFTEVEGSHVRSEASFFFSEQQSVGGWGS